MAFIDKTLSGKYQVRWTDPDGHERARTVPDKATANRLKLDVERTVAEGHRWQPRDAVSLPEIPEILKKYIENRGKRLKARTLHRYGENLDLFLRFLRTERPRGTLPVSMLSKPLLEDFHTWLLVPENGLHGHQRGPDTARKIVEVAQLAWEWADDSGRWDGVIPRPRRIEMERSEPQPVTAPEWYEMDRAIEAANGWLKPLMTFLRYTGLRVGETMLLRWSDIDLDRGHLSIRGEITKNRRGRVIPLCSPLLDLLQAWDRTTAYVIPSGRCAGERERQARPRDADRTWARAGVREAAWRGEPFHAFRNGFKTGLLALGGHADAIDFLQGHKLGRGSRDRYIDPWLALPLEDTVALIPAVGSAPKAVRLRRVV